MKQLISILALCIFLFSCGKKQEIKISAINPVTGAVYPGLKYTITEEKTGAFEEKYKIVAEGTLNENGVALVSLRLKNRSYLINLEKPSNNCYFEPQDKTFEKNSTSFDFRFEVAPCANLKLSINNLNCGGTDDIMNFRHKNSYSDFEGWSTDRLGCYSYESPSYFKTPSGWKIYNWKVNRNGIITEYLDSIYLDENESATFIIEY